MKKIMHCIVKILFTLLLVSPILGALGVFPAPTAEMYTNLEAFEFIQAMMNSGYLMVFMTITHLLALVALWTKREALAAALELPIALNIIGFHAYLDGGIFKAGAIMGNVLFIIILYIIYVRRSSFTQLFSKNS
jgi:hypothetical protein